MHIISNISDNPELCIILSVLLFMLSSLINYSLLDSLLNMHRSKSAVKKLKKEYTFLQKMRLLPVETNCRHAVNFCKRLICFQRIGWICFFVFLLIALSNAIGIFSNVFLAWISIAMFVLVDLPVLIMHAILSRPIMGRFKEYSFEKYHNTKDHDSLL